MSRVTEKLMAAGTFTIDLDPETPEHIKALSNNAFMQIIVTACHVDSEAISVASLIGLARYAGIYRKRSDDRCQWEGAGLAVMLGDEDGKGNTYAEDTTPTARPLYDGANTSVIANNVFRATGANGITIGTITSSATPTKKIKIKAGQSPREVLDSACDLFTTSGSNPKEWRINPDGSLDVSVRSTLFPTATTPTCLAAPAANAGVVSAEVDILPVTKFEQADDWEDYTTELVVTYDAPDYAFGEAYVVGDTVVATDGTYYRCKLAHTSSGANLPPNGTYWAAKDPYGTATTATTYLDLAGDDVLFRQVDSSNATLDADTADDVADRRLGRVDDPDRRPGLWSDAFDVGAVCLPGDTIWVFNPDAAIYSLSNRVEGAGGMVFPLASRVRSIEWPIRAGMGVYTVVGGATVTDVTEWVVPDERDARVEVGSPRRKLLRRRQVGVAS